jgi:hypothetical protein
VVPARTTIRKRITGVDFTAKLPASHQPAGLWIARRILISVWVLIMA